MKHLFIFSLIAMMHFASPLFSAQSPHRKHLRERLEQRRALKNNHTQQQHNSPTTTSRNSASNDSVRLIKELHYGSDLYPVDDYALDMKIDAMGNRYVLGSSLEENVPIALLIKYASNDSIIWKQNYPSDFPDIGRVALDGNDNIVVMFGYSEQDYTLVKYDNEGTMLWSVYKQYGGRDLFLDAYGNIDVLSFDDNWGKIIITQFSLSGEQQWDEEYTITGFNTAKANVMSVDNGGNIYIGGHIGDEDVTNILTLKYSIDGTLLWEKQYSPGGDYHNEVFAIVCDKSNNVIITGVSYSVESLGEEITTVKYNASGTKLWSKKFSNNIDDYYYVYDVDVDTTGNIAVCGAVSYDASLIIKYKANGTRDWFTMDTSITELTTIVADDSGNFYSGGFVIKNNLSDMAIVKYNTDGSKIWSATYDGRYHKDDIPIKIMLDSERNVFLVGVSGISVYEIANDIVTLKYNYNGLQLGVLYYIGKPISNNSLNASVMDAAGNLYVSGTDYNSSMTSDILTIKYSPNDSIEWIARYSSPGYNYDAPTAIAVDNVGNVFVTGVIYSDCVTIKYSPSGEQLWVTTYGGTSGRKDAPIGIATDNSGNAYVIANIINGSNRNADIATIKYSPDGSEEWVKIYNGEMDSVDIASSFTIDNSGNIYLAGSTMTDSSYYDFLIVKYDAQGNEHWHKTFKSDSNYYDVASGIIVTNDGKVIISGTAGKYNYSHKNIITLCLDVNGALEWVQNFDDTLLAYLRINSVALASNNHIVIAGSRYINYDNVEVYLLCYSLTGELLWQQWNGGTAYNGVTAAAQSNDGFGNIYLCSTTRNGGDIFIVKYNAYGIEQWRALYGRTPLYYDSPNNIFIIGAGDVIITGTSSSYTKEFTIVKYEQTFTGVAEENEVQKFSLSQNYPNPFNPKTAIGFSLQTAGIVTLKIYNTLGQEVEMLINNEKMEAGKHEIQFNGSTLPSGVYFYRISVDEKFSETKKFVILK
ncbi:MAG: T9SS type A sorting domain-containing protein [Bacteroidota bacterium]